jgi:hypothetical protein
VFERQADGGLQAEWETVPMLGVDAGIQQGKLFFSRLWVDEQHCQTWLDYIAQYRQAH